MFESNLNIIIRENGTMSKSLEARVHWYQNIGFDYNVIWSINKEVIKKIEENTTITPWNKSVFLPVFIPHAISDFACIIKMNIPQSGFNKRKSGEFFTGNAKVKFQSEWWRFMHCTCFGLQRSMEHWSIKSSIHATYRFFSWDQCWSFNYNIKAQVSWVDGCYECCWFIDAVFRER